uniref:Uncharacterized protein n=1 Tax=Romanomermis culicivorax TaxID=13658 RepID=A0A915J373_ROMCU
MRYNTYIGRRLRHGRQIPPFLIELWNVYQRSLNGQSCTNNDVEGWHRGFLATCGFFFPNIYKFVDCLKKQQHLHAYEIAQLTAGNLINRKNKKYKMISSHIQRIVQDFTNPALIDYVEFRTITNFSSGPIFLGTNCVGDELLGTNFPISGLGCLD